MGLTCVECPDSGKQLKWGTKTTQYLPLKADSKILLKIDYTLYVMAVCHYAEIKLLLNLM
jgi:hypothetical protein